MNKITLCTAILIAGFSVASAQSNTSADHTITLILQNSFNTIIGFGLDTKHTYINAVDFQNNLANPNVSDFQVKSNRSWNITVNPIAATSHAQDPEANQDLEYNSAPYNASFVYTASQE